LLSAEELGFLQSYLNGCAMQMQWSQGFTASERFNYICVMVGKLLG
jgi:hypothetical protein